MTMKLFQGYRILNLKRKWYMISLVIILAIHQIFYTSGEIAYHAYRILSITDVELPTHIENNLIDKAEYFQLIQRQKNDSTTNKETDILLNSITPFYWHVAKAGGTAVQTLYRQCFTLITAAEIGRPELEHEDFLRIVHANGSTNHLNVDISTVPGILRAKKLRLVQSHISQLIFSPLFDESTELLFDDENKGIMFAMFRHPVDRVVSLFYYLQKATWEPTYNPSLANMTLLEYVNSPLVEANFVLRSLVNKFTGPLSPADLDLAKEILRRKCIVGIVEEFNDSVQIFEQSLRLEPNMRVYAEQEVDFDSRQEYVSTCVNNLKKRGSSAPGSVGDTAVADGVGANVNRHSHGKIDKQSEEYKILARKNGWDMTLWTFIQQLYNEQKMMLESMLEEKDNLRDNDVSTSTSAAS